MKCTAKSYSVAPITLNESALTVVIPTRALKDAPPKDKPLVLELKRERKKRSLNMNNYLWALCDKIANKIGASGIEVYRRAIRSVGVCQYVSIAPDAYEMFETEWGTHGLGYFMEVTEKTDWHWNVRVYFGSHTYDTEQMSRLIDEIITEAEGLGIDTLTPAERTKMMEEWEYERLKNKQKQG